MRTEDSLAVERGLSGTCRFDSGVREVANKAESREREKRRSCRSGERERLVMAIARLFMEHVCEVSKIGASTIAASAS